jgi:predicted esterase
VGPQAVTPQAVTPQAKASIRHALGDKNKRYFLFGPKSGAAKPKKGFALLLILPGGDGGADFKTFCERIHRDRTDMSFIAAELISKKWREDQRIVWPTAKNTVAGMKFSTEDFIEDVVKDVARSHAIDRRRVMTLSWSSSGPAAYAASLTKGSPVKASIIAMSVFKPRFLPKLANAKGHTYYLLHSPDDRVCPFPMAGAAKRDLRAAGAAVKLSTYVGGHGWRGAAYSKIRDAIHWVQSPVEATYTSFVTDGFDEGRDTDSPKSWSQGRAIDGVKYIWDKRGASKIGSLRIDKSTKKYFPVAAWDRSFDHDNPSTVLRLGVSIRAQKVHKSLVEVRFYDEAGKFISKGWPVYIGAIKPSDPPATHDWKQVAQDVDIPARTKRFIVSLQTYGPGKVWFDDLRLSYQDQLRK